MTRVSFYAKTTIWSLTTMINFEMFLVIYQYGVLIAVLLVMALNLVYIRSKNRTILNADSVLEFEKRNGKKPPIKTILLLFVVFWPVFFLLLIKAVMQRTNHG